MTMENRITPLAAGTVSPVLPAGLLLLLGSLWGIAFSFSKMATIGGVHPVSYTFYQGVGAGIVVITICWLRGMRIPLDRLHLRYYIAVGLFGIAIPNVNLVAAINHLPAGVMVLTIPFVPLITYVIATALKMERFTPLRFAGVLFGLAGVLLIVLPRASLPDTEAAPWFLMALLTPAMYAVTNIVAERLRPPDSHSAALAGGMLVAAAVMLAPVVFAMGVLYVPKLPLGEAEIGLIGQIAVASMAYFIFFEIMRMAGPVFASFTGYIVTLTGIGWGVLIFGESHSPWVWGAAALIFTGLALVNLRRGPRYNGAAAADAESVRPGGPSR